MEGKHTAPAASSVGLEFAGQQAVLLDAVDRRQINQFKSP